MRLPAPFIKILVNLIDENWFFVAKFKIVLIATIYCFNTSILHSTEWNSQEGWLSFWTRNGKIGEWSLDFSLYSFNGYLAPILGQVLC